MSDISYTYRDNDSYNKRSNVLIYSALSNNADIGDHSTVTIWGRDKRQIVLRNTTVRQTPMIIARPSTRRCLHIIECTLCQLRDYPTN